MVTDYDRMLKFLQLAPLSDDLDWWESFARNNNYYDGNPGDHHFYLTNRIEDMMALFSIKGYEHSCKAADVKWIIANIKMAGYPVVIRTNGQPDGFGFQGLTNLGCPWLKHGVMTWLGHPEME